MTAHERLKQEFEEFKASVAHELLFKGVINPKNTRLDRIEARLKEIESAMESANKTKIIGI